MLNGKGMIIHLIVGLTKKTFEYFPKPPSDYKNIKVKIDLTNYATKKDINDITHVDTSNFALKNKFS